MMWGRLMQSMLPDLYAKTIPLSMRMSPFRCVKRTWEAAFQYQSLYAQGPANGKRVLVTVKPRVIDWDFYFTSQGTTSADNAEGNAGQEDGYQENPCRDIVPFADALSRSPLQEGIANSSDVVMSEPAFCSGSSCPVAAARVSVRKRKKDTVIDPSLQRITRSVLANKGFRVAPIKDLQPRPKKRTRKVESSSVVVASARRNPAVPKLSDSEKEAPDTASAVMVSIPVMQRIGDLLQMDPDDLTVAKLTAKPRDDDAKQPESDD